MCKARLFYLSTLLGAVIFCLLNGRWLSWFLLLAALALPLLSLLVSLSAMLTTRMTLHVPSRIPVNCDACVTAAIQSKWLQLPFRVKLSVFQPLTGVTRILLPGQPLPTDHCGGLIVTPQKAYCYDLLGLWQHKLPRLSPIQIFVMPNPVRHDVPNHLTQYLAFSWRPKPGGGYSEQHELREYRPGDNLNQIHWKLSAKTGDLIIREAMEPLHSRLLLTVNLRGTPQELDHKLGQLLWMGEYLLGESLRFSVLALTGNGPLEQDVTTLQELQTCLEALLCSPCATAGTILTHKSPAAWHCHIGGVTDEN